jgi:hypothetical protein
MPNAYSLDLSERVVCFVEDGNSRLAQGRAARQRKQDDRHSVAGHRRNLRSL